MRGSKGPKQPVPKVFTQEQQEQILSSNFSGNGRGTDAFSTPQVNLMNRKADGSRVCVRASACIF